MISSTTDRIFCGSASSALAGTLGGASLPIFQECLDSRPDLLHSFVEAPQPTERSLATELPHMCVHHSSAPLAWAHHVTEHLSFGLTSFGQSDAERCLAAPVPSSCELARLAQVQPATASAAPKRGGRAPCAALPSTVLASRAHVFSVFCEPVAVGFAPASLS